MGQRASAAAKSAGLEVQEANLHPLLQSGADAPLTAAPRKEEFSLPNRTAEVHFLLHDVLSQKECDSIIAECSKLGKLRSTTLP